MTDAEATPMILNASQALLDRYPQSEYAPVAREIVDRIALTEIRRKEATNEE
jgi:hypothetical protein